MLRGVMALATVGLSLSVPASAGELITYPTLARGTLAFAPVPFATLDIDWLGTFATSTDATELLAVAQLGDFLSGTPEGGSSSALIGPAELTGDPHPPTTAQRAYDWLEPWDLQ